VIIRGHASIASAVVRSMLRPEQGPGHGYVYPTGRTAHHPQPTSRRPTGRRSGFRRAPGYQDTPTEEGRGVEVALGMTTGSARRLRGA
jgi:hypothetical protein